MELITIRAVSSQDVIVTLEGFRYEIALKDADGFMVFGIIRDGVTIIEPGMRIVNDSPFLPYLYLEQGNFILDLPDDEIPDYKQFGITQFLRYATDAELKAVR